MAACFASSKTSSSNVVRLERLPDRFGQLWICEFMEAAPFVRLVPPEVPSVNPDSTRRTPAIHERLPCSAQFPSCVCWFPLPTTKPKPPPAQPRTHSIPSDFNTTPHGGGGQHHQHRNDSNRNAAKWQTRYQPHPCESNNGNPCARSSFGPALLAHSKYFSQSLRSRFVGRPTGRNKSRCASRIWSSLSSSDCGVTSRT